MVSSLPTSPSPSLDLSKPDAAGQVDYELHLYVVGTAPRSENARRNLEAICQQYLPGRHSLTIIDLHEHPEKAGEDEILGVPCQVKKRPGLVRRLVGDLADRDRVLRLLGLL